MKYKKGEYTLILFSKVGVKKRTKVFPNYLLAKSALDEYINKHKKSSGVITRVLHNSAYIDDKWTYKGIHNKIS